MKYFISIKCIIFRLIKNNESPELEDLRKKIFELQEQLKSSLDKSQRAEEEATEKSERVTLNLTIITY